VLRNVADVQHQCEDTAKQDKELQSRDLSANGKSSPAKHSCGEGELLCGRESSVDAHILQGWCDGSSSHGGKEETRVKVGGEATGDTDREKEGTENMEGGDPGRIDQMVQTTFSNEKCNRQNMRNMYRKFHLIRRKCKTESKSTSSCLVC
jgi:hypothetical protein